MPELDVLTSQAKALARSVDLWNNWRVAATITAAVAAVLTVITNFKSLSLGKELSAKQSEISQIKEQAANLKLEQQKQITLNLEARIQPRFLNAEETAGVKSAMRRFSDLGFLISSYWIDAEAAQLAGQIKRLLNEAGMGLDTSRARTTTRDLIGEYPELPGTLFGATPPTLSPVHSGIELWGDDQAAIDALKSALGPLKPRQVSSAPPEIVEGNATPLGIFVGVKPLPE